MAIFLLCLGIFLEAVSAWCPNGWVQFKDSCYSIHSTKLSWLEADTECGFHNGRLAAPDDREKNIFFKRVLLKMPSGQGSMWVGGNDQLSDGYWEWSRSNNQVGFSDWASGEPLRGTVSNCMKMDTDDGYKWRAASCDSKMSYICELKAKIPCIPTKSTSSPIIFG